MSQEAPPEVVGREDVFADYRAPAGVFDEFRAVSGAVRPVWNPIVEAADSWTADRLQLLALRARQFVEENGVTYNVFGDHPENARPWEIDPIPFVLAPENWEFVSTGLQQRARLLNALIGDLYGPQRLIRSGEIPPEVIFGHPDFQRGFHNLPTPPNGHLQVYAAELARGANGNWHVMADRTDAPAGSGYALENRIVVSRLLPDLFHDCQVQRLAAYFISLQAALENATPGGRENPRIVILSRGPGSPYYFEDVYLSRYLGYPLVQSGDLAVRNERVSLKTLSGLLPIDVIFSRMPEQHCDPLELGARAHLGVPGLMQAIRSQNVAIVNCLGCGLVEAPVFMALLPRLCRVILGEELLLPSIATWWCHEPQSLNYVLGRLRELVIKPAFRHSGDQEIFVDTLSAAEYDRLVEQLRRDPTSYVAQERIARSATPVWDGAVMRAGHVAMRTFLTADADSYAVMPGALVRVASTPGPLELSISAGDGSKDAWVISHEPIRPVSLLKPASSTVTLKRGSVDLPSRVADHLYWFGRQLERADSLARLWRTTIDHLVSESESEEAAAFGPLLRALAEQGQIEPGFVIESIRDPLPSLEAALPLAMFDSSDSSSLLLVLRDLHRLASVVRDRISVDSYRIIARLQDDFHLEPVDVGLNEAIGRLDQLVIDLLACFGLANEGMTHGLAWTFLDLGRRVERAAQIINLCRWMIVPEHGNEPAVLHSLLDLIDSKMTYRSRYLASLAVYPVADLLLTDETCPRSLIWQIQRLVEQVERLPREPQTVGMTEEQQLAEELIHAIRMLPIQHAGAVDSRRRSKTLEPLLDQFESLLNRLSDRICRRYFIHAGPPRQLNDLLVEVPQ